MCKVGGCQQNHIVNTTGSNHPNQSTDPQLRIELNHRAVKMKKSKKKKGEREREGEIGRYKGFSDQTTEQKNSVC